VETMLLRKGGGAGRRAIVAGPAGVPFSPPWIRNLRIHSGPVALTTGSSFYCPPASIRCLCCHALFKIFRILSCNA
jgi:hypothetical protein